MLTETALLTKENRLGQKGFQVTFFRKYSENVHSLYEEKGFMAQEVLETVYYIPPPFREIELHLYRNS